MAGPVKRISVSVDADGRGAIAGFKKVGDAAEEAAARATEAGAKVSAAAVKQADSTAQQAARAAETATAEARAALEAFAEGSEEEYQRATAAAEKSAASAQAAWEKSAAASVKAQSAAAKAVGTDQEAAAAKAAEAAKASSLQAEVMWHTARTASSDAASLAEADASRMAGAVEGATARGGNAFTKLGQAAASWGIPFAGSITKMGDQFAQAETGTAKLGSALSSVGKAVTVGGIVGLAAVGVESVKMAGNFQSAAEHLVTDAGESQSALAGVSKGMLAISAATGTSAADVVNGMYHIESAGQHGAAGISILQAAAQGAKVGNADLDTVSKTLVGTMNSFHVPASQATNMMNQLIAAVGAGDMRMEDLASSLGNVSPIAAAAGLSFAQVGGAIATMTSQNMSAQQATQDLNNLIRNLQKPNDVAKNAMAQMGLNANTVSAQLGQKGLTGTLNELVAAISAHMGPSGMVLQDAFNQSQGAAANMRTELAKMPPAAKQVAEQFAAGSMTVQQYRTAVKAMPVDQQAMLNGFVSTYNQAHKFNQLLTSGAPAAQTFTAALAHMTGGATGLNTSLMLTGGNAATFQTNVNTVAAAAEKSGKNVDNWGKIQQNFNQQLDQARTTVADLGIRFGLFLIPKLQEAAKDTSEVVSWFEQHKTVAEALAGVIGGTLSVAVGAFTINKIAGLVKGVSSAVGSLKSLGNASGDVITRLANLGSTSSTVQAQAAKAVTTVNQSAGAAGANLQAAGTKASQSLETGAATAGGDISAGGATAKTELATAGATAETELTTGGATAAGDLVAAGGEVAAITPEVAGLGAAAAGTEGEMGALAGVAGIAGLSAASAGLLVAFAGLGGYITGKLLKDNGLGGQPSYEGWIQSHQAVANPGQADIGQAKAFTVPTIGKHQAMVNPSTGKSVPLPAGAWYDQHGQVVYPTSTQTENMLNGTTVTMGLIGGKWIQLQSGQTADVSRSTAPNFMGPLPAGPAQHRAAGGPVSAGYGYIVNEHGTEWFQPNIDGTVLPVPLAAGGGGSDAAASSALAGQAAMSFPGMPAGMGGATIIQIENLTLPGVSDANTFEAQIVQKARLTALAGGAAMSRPGG